VVLCRRIDLFSDASIAIDGSKFNTRDRNFTQAKMQRRLEQIDESINVSKSTSFSSERAFHEREQRYDLPGLL
jgi:hypothetical protein